MTVEPPLPKITTKFKQLLRNGNDGTYGHECILDDLGDAVISRDTKLDIVNRCNGKPDAIIEKNKQKAVLEIKRVKESRYKPIKRFNKPERSMALQLLYYMWRLKLPGWLYIENKNDQEYIEFFYPTWDVPLLDYIKNKIESINNNLDNNTLPDREHAKSSRECKWCKWKDICY